MEEPRDDDLEAALARDPYDVHAYGVYADFLQVRGHPRGELIAHQLAAMRGHDGSADDAADLMAIHAGELLGPLVHERRLALEWRCGFIHSAAAIGHDDASSRDVVRAVAALLAHPSARLLVSLDVRPTQGGQDLVELLVHALPPSVRDLCISTRDPLDLRALWPRCGRLRRLRVGAAELELGAPALPCVEHAAFDPSIMRGRCARAIASAPWPELAQLDLWLGRGEHDREPVTIADVRPLLYRDLPVLARLRARNAAFGSELVGELVTCPLAEQLAVLDLSYSVLDDADVRTLARFKDRFPRLRELRLPEHVATDTARARFAGTSIGILDDSEMPTH